MKLFAISDLHVRFAENRALLQGMSAHPDDWLILGGDLGESVEDLTFVLETMQSRFAKLIWVPGNHELWTVPGEGRELRGEAKYAQMIEVCRSMGVFTPEDPYPSWPESPEMHRAASDPSGDPVQAPSPFSRLVIAPLFLLYDYSFRPDDVPIERAVEWAAEAGLSCTDEALLHPDPHRTIPDWCAERCRATEQRLAEIPADAGTILINHFPLLYDHAWLPRIPRFSIWCGTRRTHDWPKRFRAQVVVYGHLHIRWTRVEDGVRYEEVSLGYPRQWMREKTADAYLRQIWPPPAIRTGYHY